MLSGKTHFKLYQKDAASFTPSSFIVLEENIKGQQAWRTGDHFHGLELTVSADFIENVLYPVFLTVSVCPRLRRIIPIRCSPPACSIC